MKRLLLTGASGFIGRNTLPLLAAAGYDVHAVGTHPMQTHLCSWHECDLLDARAVSVTIPPLRASHLLHLAWDMPHGALWSLPGNLDWVEASLRLVRAFRDGGGKRAAFAGTCAEYDWAQAMPLTERDGAIEPATLYGAAKAELFRLLTRTAPDLGIEVAWGRIFHLYGPHEDPRRLVPQIAASLVRGTPFRGTRGEQMRDYMHVRDLATDFVALLESDFCGAVNVASGTPTTVGDIARMLGRISGRPELLRLGDLADRPGDPPVLLANVALLRERIGCGPRVELERGLSETLAWWRSRLA